MVGHQNVEPAEAGDGRRYQFPGRLGPFEVTLQGMTVVRTAFPDQIVGLPFGRVVVEDNLRASLDKQAHRGGADSTGSAGNKSDFGVQGQVHMNKTVSNKNGLTA